MTPEPMITINIPAWQGWCLFVCIVVEAGLTLIRIIVSALLWWERRKFNRRYKPWPAK